MSIRETYNEWAAQYDTNRNRTRDLEGAAMREILAAVPFTSCLEIGCGTGKNTVWLAERAAQTTSVDLSEGMLAVARVKVTAPGVRFIQADIRNPWTFATGSFELVTFSLVLEHLAETDHVFREAAACLKPGGHLYLGELHPFKQYSGSKARFESEKGTQVAECYTHHISEFIEAGMKCGLHVAGLREYFDEGDRGGIPRILTILFRKEK